MADLGLALGDAIPKIINMRSSIADLQDRAKRMRMEEELQPLRKQALEGNVQAQNIANETNTMALNEAKMNAERRNQPVDLNKLDWTDPFVHITAQVGQRTGRWPDIPTRGHIEDIQKEIVTNPQLYVKDFQDQFTAIQTSKEYAALKRESEVAKANILEQQKIINTSTNIKEIQKAREEIEKINEAGGGTKEQLDVIEAKRSKLLKSMSTFDKSIELKQIFEDYKSLLPSLSPQAQQSLQIAASMGDTGTVGKILEEQSKAREIKPENITGQFITNKNITVGYSDKTGLIAYEKDMNGNMKTVPYNQQQHGDLIDKKQEAINKRSMEARYVQIKGQFDNDKSVEQFKRTQLSSSYLDKAYLIYKKTGNAGILDQALIVTQGKISDPESAVLIGEFLINKGMQSVIQKFEGNISKLINSSAGLSKEYREALYEAVQFALENKANVYNQRVDSARADAAAYEIPQDRIEKAFPYAKNIGIKEESNLGGQTSTGNRFIEKEIP